MKSGLAAIASRSDAGDLTSQYEALVGPPAATQGANAPNTLTGISTWLDKFAAAADSADGAPSVDALRGFAALSAQLDGIEPRWRSFAAAARSRIPVSQ